MSKRILFLSLCATALIATAGCGGGGSSNSGTPVTPITPIPTSAPTATPTPQTNIYTTNFASNSILRFPANSTGNVAPVFSITGANTTINQASAVAVDNNGNMYTANYVFGLASAGSIVEFKADTTGNEVPTNTITGNLTGLGSGRISLATDSAGNLYATSTAIGYIQVFAAGATGNIAPIQEIDGPAANLDITLGIAVDSSKKIYALSETATPSFYINTYAAGATGAAAPTSVLTLASSADTQGIAVDSTGKIYVTSTNPPSVDVYAAGASGSAAPIATIAGANTQMTNPYGIAVDASGKIYVTDSTNNAVIVFASGATGNATPVATINGSSTTFDTPQGIVVK